MVSRPGRWLSRCVGGSESLIMANTCPDHSFSPVFTQVSEVSLRVLKTAAIGHYVSPPGGRARPYRATSCGGAWLLSIKIAGRNLAGLWPDKDEHYRSTMRTSERHLAKSVGICPGRQHPRLSLRIRWPFGDAGSGLAPLPVLAAKALRSRLARPKTRSYGRNSISHRHLPNLHQASTCHVSGW